MRVTDIRFFFLAYQRSRFIPYVFYVQEKQKRKQITTKTSDEITQKW